MYCSGLLLYFFLQNTLCEVLMATNTCPIPIPWNNPWNNQFQPGIYVDYVEVCSISWLLFYGMCIVGSGFLMH